MFAEINLGLFTAFVLDLLLVNVDVACCFGRLFQPNWPDLSCQSLIKGSTLFI